MFEGQSPLVGANQSAFEPPKGRSKKLIFVILTLIILGAGGFAAFYFWSKRPVPPNINNPATSTPSAATSGQPILPNLDPGAATSTANATSSFNDLAIEYLSFADFYKAPSAAPLLSSGDYNLPLDVKIDVTNYYDVSRKIDLDPGLDSLSNNGFALVDNPWEKEAKDFYTLYANLDQKQIPLLITSDFLLYYYQNTLKKVFKEIESTVFYDNLWDVNKEMYEAAKSRYETRLASIGQVNDSILEGERLEAAFFATALELMKPAANQLAPKGTVNDPSRFTESEANRFYFSLPPYLREDVIREEKLIRDGALKAKSPVMLYPRDYTDFKVPVDYRANAKLNNFYLTTKWLNSVFPLNYKDRNCPDCLLDYPDWRISLTAASFIAQDFSSLPELKNKWARIYKVMAFFKGLRDDLGYVQYRDSLSQLFGADYKIEQIFDDQNRQVKDNLENLRKKLVAYNFSAVQGAYSRQDASQKKQIGFRMLAEPYWPNEYIFRRLAQPTVSNYLDGSPKTNNITSCRINQATQRCNAFALDAINLAFPITNNDYFSENTNYNNYSSTAAALAAELDQATVWQTANYWSLLNQMKAYLGGDRNQQPAFARSAAWPERSLNTAAAAWTNLQLPLEQTSAVQVFKGQGLGDLSRWNEGAYVEPNYALLAEMIANNKMLLGMFSALRLDREVSAATNELSALGKNLEMLQAVITKELKGEEISADDNEKITDFVKSYSAVPTDVKNRQLTVSLNGQKTNFKEDISRFQLLVIIQQTAKGKFLVVGPVWNYKETR